MGAEKACYGCHAIDHLVADCPQKGNYKNGTKTKKNGAEGNDPNEEKARAENNEKLQSKKKENHDSMKITNEKKDISKESNC